MNMPKFKPWAMNPYEPVNSVTPKSQLWIYYYKQFESNIHYITDYPITMADMVERQISLEGYELLTNAQAADKLQNIGNGYYRLRG